MIPPTTMTREFEVTLIIHDGRIATTAQTFTPKEMGTIIRAMKLFIAENCTDDGEIKLSKNKLRRSLRFTPDTLAQGTDDHCCGACRFMQYEDTDGYGYCNNYAREVHCSNVCQHFESRAIEN